MKNIGYSPTLLYIIVIVVIIFYNYNLNKKKEYFSEDTIKINICPDYCHDNTVFYNMDNCKECFSKGGKYEKTQEELDKVKIFVLPPHDENCPGLCNESSYRYGVCSGCFKEGGFYEHIKEGCGDYCHKHSSKTGRCKSCFEPGGRLNVDETVKATNVKECRDWCNETSYRYGICAPCFKKGGKFADIKEPCYEECNEFSSKNGRCSNCFKEGGRFFYNKTDYIKMTPSEYIPFVAPKIEEDLSFNCPHYCTTKSSKEGSCRACFEEGGIYYDIEDVCYEECNRFSNPEGYCKPCFYKGERLYIEPIPDPPHPLPPPPPQQTIELPSHTPPPPPQDPSPGCHWFCNENSYPIGVCSKCFEEEGAFFEVTKKCMNFCSLLDKDLDLCKPCFKEGERLYIEPKPVIEEESYTPIPIENPPKCPEWCNNSYLYHNINYDKYCIKEESKLGNNCYIDRTHIPEKVINPETCKCDNGIGEKSIDCAKDKTIEKCVSCYDGNTLDSNNKCISNTCICDNGSPHSGVNCPDITKHSCYKCDQGYTLVKGKCYKRYDEFDSSETKNKYNPIENKGYFNLTNLTEEFKDYSVHNNYIDPSDGGPVREDENMSIAKVNFANTLKSCKQNCNIFDTCGGIAYKKDSIDECYTMSTSQKWLSRDEPDNLNDLWTTYKRLNPETPPMTSADLINGKIQYFRHKPNIDFRIRFNQNASRSFNYDINKSSGEPTSNIVESEHDGTIDSCKDLCNSLDSCGGFSYNKKTNKCYLKNNNLFTLSLMGDLDYDTYDKMNITGVKPEYPSCPVNCNEQTKENIFRDNFVSECVRPQNTGENCLSNYPDMEIIIRVQIDKLIENAKIKSKEATDAYDYQTSQNAQLELSSSGYEASIDVHLMSEDELKLKKDEEDRIARDIEQYKLAVAASIALYEQKIEKYNEELRQSEIDYQNRVDQIEKIREDDEKERNRLLEDRIAATESQNQQIADEIERKIIENTELAEFYVAQQKEIEEERDKLEEERRKKVEERERKVQEAAAEYLRAQTEREEKARLEAEAYLERLAKMHEKIAAEKAAEEAAIRAATLAAEAEAARIAAELKRIKLQRELRLAKVEEEAAKRALENRDIAESVSTAIHNTEFTTKQTTVDVPCTECSTDGKCGNIYNNTCYKPCCTRNGKPQYCSRYGWCGPSEDGYWANESMYKNSNNSACDSATKTCSDLNPNYGVEKTTIVKTEVQTGTTTLSTDMETLQSSLDQVHKTVTENIISPEIRTNPILEIVVQINENKEIIDGLQILSTDINKKVSDSTSSLSIIKEAEESITEELAIASSRVEEAIALSETKASEVLTYQEEKQTALTAKTTAETVVLKVNQETTLAVLKNTREATQDVDPTIVQETANTAASEVQAAAAPAQREAEEAVELAAKTAEEAVAAHQLALEEAEAAEVTRLEEEANMREKTERRERLATDRAATEIQSEAVLEQQEIIDSELDKANERDQELQERKNKALESIYNIVNEEKQIFDNEGMEAYHEAFRMEEAKKHQARLAEFEELAKKKVEKHYRLESSYPDPDNNSKELRNTNKQFISIKYQHIATMAAYNHLFSDYRKLIDGNMTKDFDNLLSISAEEKSPYSGYDSSITGIKEIKEDLKTKFNEYIAAINYTTQKFKPYDLLQKDYDRIIDIRKQSIESKGHLAAIYKIVWTSSTDVLQDELDDISSRIPTSLSEYVQAKAISDSLRNNLLTVLKNEADILTTNQSPTACKYTNIEKKIYGDKLSCCGSDQIDKDGNCCHLSVIDCMGVCGGITELDACGVCGGTARDSGMCSENTNANNFNRNLAGTQNSYNSSGGDTRTAAERALHEKQESIQRCDCPGGWPYGMVYDWTTLEPIKWSNTIDVENGCTKDQPIKCRGFNVDSPYRYDNGDIKNYCKDNNIPKTATLGLPITQKHYEDSKFLGCKLPENQFSCPNGIAHIANYSEGEGYLDRKTWVAIGLTKPDTSSQNELINPVLSNLLDTQTSFTSDEWLDISGNFQIAGMGSISPSQITSSHYIKANSDIYYKPFLNSYPKTDGEINCKSCDDGYLLQLRVPTGRTCALGTGCPVTKGVCVQKQKECACFDPLRLDNHFISCYDGAKRQINQAFKFDAGGGREEISRVGKCHKCYSGRGPWQDPARGSTNTNDTGIDCTTDADCSAEWIGKWDNMPGLDSIDKSAPSVMKPNIRNYNNHKEITHRKTSSPVSQGHSFTADYVLRKNQDKLAPNTKAYGRNYKCIKPIGANGKLTDTGKCCFGFRPIEMNTPQIDGNDHRSSFGCTRDGQMKCNADRCGANVQVNYLSSALNRVSKNVPRTLWGEYNPHTDMCARYINNTDIHSNSESTRKYGCNWKYSLIDGREYTEAGSGCHPSLSEYTIPDEPKQSWLDTKKLAEEYIIDTSISDDTPYSELTAEQKKREKYTVDKSGNFTNETDITSPEAYASYWNKGNGMGHIDPNKIELIYY